MKAFHPTGTGRKIRFLRECLLYLVAVQCTIAYSLPSYSKDFVVVFPSLVDGNLNAVSNDVRNFSRYTRSIFPHFQAFDRNFTLQLNENSELLTNEFLIEKIPQIGEGVAANDADAGIGGKSNEKGGSSVNFLEGHCYFVGIVRDDFRSSVAVDICKGLSGVIVSNDEEYYIEPISVHADSHTDSGVPHAFYKRSWINLPISANDDVIVSFESSRDESALSHAVVHEETVSHSHRTPVTPRRGQRSLRHTPSIETLVVADKTMVDFHGEKNVKDYLLTVMNMVSNIYRDTSIGKPVNVVIVRLVIVEKAERDSFTVSFSAKSTLQSFCSWQKRHNFPSDRHPYHHDAAVLFTRKDICGLGNFPCGSIGMAMQGGMCNSKYSCSVVQDTGLNTAFTVAQMLGHNIGLVSLKRTVCGVRGSASFIMSPRRLKSPHTNRFEWSPCSRVQLSRILRGRAGKCLLDQAVPLEKQNVTLPGQQYDLDSQCRFLNGKNSSFCHGALEDVCSILWCMQHNRNRGCTTNREPAAEGSFCNYKKTKWCIGGKCVPRISRPRVIDGQWGSWSKWSACSRTCGGGIMKSVRDCDNPRPSFKGESCHGERKRHRLCNTKKCNENGVSFRDVQCAGFNSKMYRGRFHRWKGFYVKAKECSLVCRSEKYRFYALMNLHVADGTPCRIGSYDRCIEGECKKVGCDNVIGSNAKEDLCGKCKGNNTDCLFVRKDFKKRHGVGYVTVGYIPRGSTSIRIVEKTASRNYLALETTFGENVINGGYTIQRPGILHRLNSIVEYKRIGLFEQIVIKGPISKDIKLMILFQADASSIQYQFAEQNNANRAQFKTRDRYIWKHDNSSRDAWSTCSKTCGRGLHHGKFECLDIFRGRYVNVNLCDKSEKPLFVKPCENLPPCPKKRAGRWKLGSWGACSVSCGDGMKTRSVSCSEVNTGEAVDESLCKEKKPKARRQCKKPICPREMGIWVFGQWDRCSRTCGNGLRKRVVKCMNLAGKMLDRSRCDSARKPAMVDRCGSPCAKWVAGEWGECPSSCSNKQRRCVLCINMHSFTTSKECHPADKPVEERTCSSGACS